MVSRINCPLCAWVMDPEPPDFIPGGLIDVFGLGVMQSVAWNEHLQKTERELRDHLGSHDLVEWVRKVAELQAELDGLAGHA